MKLHLGTTILCLVATTVSGAVDIYNAYSLPDLGNGSKSRHVVSWNGAMAVAAGEVNDALGTRHAAGWIHITNAGPGSLNLLPTPNPSGASTAGSAAGL